MDHHAIIFGNSLNGRQNKINIKSDFFKKGHSYVLKVDDEKISFTRPSLDYVGKTAKAVDGGGVDYFKFTITSDLLPKYNRIEINSDDITEDELIVYYN